MEGQNTPASSDANSNVQASQPSPVTGQSDAQTRLEALEREKKGIYEDLKAKREQHQQLKEEYEKLKAQVEASQRQPVLQQQSQVDELDAELAPRVAKYIAPIAAQAARAEEMETILWLSEQEGRKYSEVKNDQALQKALVETAQKYGIRRGSLSETAMAAYELYKRDKRDQETSAKQAEDAAKVAEAERLKAIAGNSTESRGLPPSGSQKIWTREEIGKLSTEEYRKVSADIQNQFRAGLIK